MKIVFYKSLLAEIKKLTPSERILYSFLASKAIQRIDEVFEKDGRNLNNDELEFYLEANKNRVPICKLNHTRLSEELCQTRATIINGIKHLKQLGIIKNNQIYIQKELAEQGYFELVHAEMLCGELLIFYSYLVDLSKKNGLLVSAKKETLKSKIHKSPVAITKMLNRLYELGLAKRLKNGKLQIIL